MFLKIMSTQDLPDHDYRKGYELIECARVKFVEEDLECSGISCRKKVAKVDFDGDGGVWMSFVLTGNAYIINDNGKTVATASPNLVK